MPTFLNQIQLRVDVRPEAGSWVGLRGDSSSHPFGPYRQVAFAEGGNHIVARGEILVDGIPRQAGHLAQSREGETAVALGQEDGLRRLKKLALP